MYLKLNESKIKGKFQIKLILPKLTTVLINMINLGPRMLLRGTLQLLRANIWVRLVSTLVMVVVDVVRFLTRQISKKQFVLDIVLSLSLLLGGTAGWYTGTSAVLGIVSENTVLWVVAGVVGAGLFGAGSEYAAKKIMVRFIKPDKEEMMEIFNKQFDELLSENNLSPEQATECAKKVPMTPKICLACFKAKNREDFARNYLAKYFPH